MFLQIREITPSDLRHLHCTDPALRAEVDAINRSIHRRGEKMSNSDTPAPNNGVGIRVDADHHPAIIPA